jgi:opacity protein-like surface antigen
MTALRLAALALAVATAGTADAADLFNGAAGGSMKDTTIAPMQTAGTGWYFRLDGGYALFDRPSIVDGGTTDLTSTEINNTWSLGGGVGYHFSRNVRADVTYDHHFAGDVQGVQFYTIPTTTTPSNLTAHASLTSDVVLANLYYDFDTGSRFTPYIGAGLGFAHHQVGGGGIDNDCSCAFTGSIGAGGSDHVAGALMAGASYQVWGGPAFAYGSTKDVYMPSSRNLSLDLGYRFLYLGQTQTGAVALADASGNSYAIASKATVDDLHAHEFRVGLRYDLH